MAIEWGRPVRKHGARIETFRPATNTHASVVAPCESTGRGLKQRIMRLEQLLLRSRPVRKHGARIETRLNGRFVSSHGSRPVRKHGARIETLFHGRCDGLQHVAPCESTGRGLKLTHFFDGGFTLAVSPRAKARGA